MAYLTELASVIRSKNAGPLTLSFDLLFRSDADFRRALASPSLSAQAIARLYDVEADEVSIVPYAAARAIKIAMPRAVVAGSPGDRDVYGAQQHAPLLRVEL